MRILETKDLTYGPAKVMSGPLAGHIVYFDDEEYPLCENEECEGCANCTNPHPIVYLGDMFMCLRLNLGFYILPPGTLGSVYIDDLISRREAISRALTSRPDRKVRASKQVELLVELQYIESLIVERSIEAQFFRTGRGKKVFISHSSKDIDFALRLATDLRAVGHVPWISDWRIRVGDSIPERVSMAIEESDHFIVILSKSSVTSKWVEREWHAKYWSENKNKNCSVIPILYEDCRIPALLRNIKYADFSRDTRDGLAELLLLLASGDAGQSRPRKSVSRSRKKPER
ncbi:toll/interleukin-1 receptor domain-containing protein [Pyxidicoccus sp. 3LFB2]